jgi:hypothetical protein
MLLFTFETTGDIAGSAKSSINTISFTTPATFEEDQYFPQYVLQTSSK